MLAQIAKGPMSVCVDATLWQTYVSGVITAASGCGTSIDHAVQAIGYNKAGNYWIVRNSWGESWGENGYVYVEEGANVCGITAQATITVPAKVTRRPRRVSGTIYAGPRCDATRHNAGRRTSSRCATTAVNLAAAVVGAARQAQIWFEREKMRVAAFTTLVALAARARAEPPPDLPGDDCWDMPPDLQQLSRSLLPAVRERRRERAAAAADRARRRRRRRARRTARRRGPRRSRRRRCSRTPTARSRATSPPSAS